MTKELYSQRDEQIHIVKYFENWITGRFIDIGSYDVFKFSNVRALVEMGWGGIMVEPAPENYKAIADYYKDNNSIRVFNFAIGTENKEIDFYDCGGDAISTSDISHRDKWAAAGVQYKKISVRQIDIREFMKTYQDDCDFLNIDTESTNFEIFNAIQDDVWHRISMLCIEHDGHYEEIEDKLKPFGFLPLYQSAENIILAK